MRFQVDYQSSWYTYFMEGDHFVLIFGLTCASLAIGAYVLFGPNFGNKKKTPVLGLQNLGQTCFMNTILQALGSCPIFIKWLDSQTPVLGEVGIALKNILQKLGQVSPDDSTECIIQPLEFMTVLSQHGWQMNLYNNMQQDAHELLTFVLSKVEDEILFNIKNQRNGLGWIDKDTEEELSLNTTSSSGDSLGPLTRGEPVRSPLNGCLPSMNGGGSATPSGDSSRRTMTLKQRKKKLSLANTNVQTNCATSFRGRLVSQIRCTMCGHENPLKYDNFDSLSLHLPLQPRLHIMSSTHTLQGLLEEFVKTEIISEFECEMCNKDLTKTAPTKEEHMTPQLPSDGDQCSSHSITNADTNGLAALSDSQQASTASSSDINCESQSHQSSLLLNNGTQTCSTPTKQISGENSSPPSTVITHGDGLPSPLSSTVVSKFVPPRSPASSSSVSPTARSSPAASKRKVLCDAVKTLRLGKLPPCLCFHIHRTFYSAQGAYKRQDYVDFPEYLVMDPYTYNAALREKEVKKKMVIQLNGGMLPNGASMSYRAGHAANVYRLKAVVVHRGSAEDGHFVTYRRGPLRSLSRHRCPPPSSSSSSTSNSNDLVESSFESRWYFTSDADIRQSSLAQALKSVAYMLFYEKCSPALLQTENDDDRATSSLPFPMSTPAQTNTPIIITPNDNDSRLSNGPRIT
uniref:ubiquitinyl hydrolase 1 n=2 Tax=Cacopsylla melanoneura TaxID=428564 RepID=A0A8D8YJ86_9HEMI